MTCEIVMSTGNTIALASYNALTIENNVLKDSKEILNYLINHQWV